MNAGGPRNVVAAAESAGVRRLLHMSAAGVTERNAPRTRYWRTKLAGKHEVMESSLDWTVFEPSFVFGKGGGALKTFEGLLRPPVVVVIGDGRYRHQPVWIGDVARAYVVALERPETIGKRYELGGPQVFEFDELLDDLARITGRPPRRKIHVPVGLMMAQAGRAQPLPAAPQGDARADRDADRGHRVRPHRDARGPADRAGLAGRGLHEIGEIPPGD